MKIQFFVLGSLLAWLAPPAFASSPTAALSRELLRDWADHLLADTDYRPEELKDPALSAVTREFGPSVVPLAALPFESPVAVADTTPWSSWWFPRIDRDLFDDGFGTSPLEKYDFVRAALSGRPSRAAKFEADRHNPSGPRWEGLCDAWAIASILFPEPRAERIVPLNGSKVAFSVGDQKALLLKTLEAAPAESFKFYGQRFSGDNDGWIFPDLFPQEFHRFVEVQLFQRKKPFIMDHDPGVEVWSEPVYKANYKVLPVQGRDDAVFVRLWIYSAAPQPKREHMNRVGLKEIVREYDYYLYGKPDGSGGLVVESGVWAKGDLVDSRRDHPDFVYVIENPSAVRRASNNPEIDPAVVDRIVNR